MIFNLTRPFMIAVVLVLACCPQTLRAQRGVGRGNHGGAPTTPKGEPAEDSSLKDFSKAIALQADAAQVDQFHQLMKDTTAAVDKTADLAQHPEKIKQQADILAYVVEVARGDSHDFIQGFSHAQKSGLKMWRKNVEKADADVGKSWNALSKDITRDPEGETRLAADNLNLQQALAKFQEEQGRLAQQMSISLRPPDESNHPAGERPVDDKPVDLHSRPAKGN